MPFLVLLALIGVLWLFAPAPKVKQPERVMAPAGTYFLRGYVPIWTSSGITGLLPGTELLVDSTPRVAVSGASRDSLALTDGVHSLIVPASMVTRSVEEAEDLRDRDDQQQAEAQAAADARLAAFARGQQARAIAAANDMDRVNRLMVTSSMFRYEKHLNDPVRTVGGGDVGPQ